MSNSSPTESRRDAPTDSATDRSDETSTLEVLAPSVAEPIRVAGFWGAIVLPILYLPVLAYGLSSSLGAGLFLTLVVLNLAALYVGHAHRQRQ